MAASLLTSSSASSALRIVRCAIAEETARIVSRRSGIPARIRVSSSKMSRGRVGVTAGAEELLEAPPALLEAGG